MVITFERAKRLHDFVVVVLIEEIHMKKNEEIEADGCEDKCQTAENQETNISR